MLSEPVTMLRRVKLFNSSTQKLDAVARLLDAWPWTQGSLTGTPNEYCETESTGFTLRCESSVNLSGLDASTSQRKASMCSLAAKKLYFNVLFSP